jgi:two-component system sensor histidine kinase UhpB
MFCAVLLMQAPLMSVCAGALVVVGSLTLFWRQRTGVEQSLRESEARARELAGKLIRVQEAEYSRVAREVHDDITQHLALLSIRLNHIRHAEGTPPAMYAQIADIEGEVQAISQDVRRVSRNLHPSILRHVGLAAALGELGQQCAMEAELGMDTELDRIDSLPEETELSFYRIAQEALRNVVRHAAAENVSMRLSERNGRIELAITDDGCGLDPGNHHDHTGIGLSTMEERARLIGASFRVDRPAGGGCRIVVDAPCPPVSDVVAGLPR